MEINELTRAHQEVVDRVRALRADMSATWLLMDCLVMGLDPAQRASLSALFAEHRERFMAGALAHSTEAGDRSIAALEAATERIGQRLKALPQRKPPSTH